MGFRRYAIFDVNLRMRKAKGVPGTHDMHAMTLGHVHTVMSHGDSDGGTRDSTPSV